MFVIEGSASVVRKIVKTIYQNPWSTVIFTAFSLIYGIMSKKLYAPPRDYLMVLNPDHTEKDKELERSRMLCEKIMNISSMMTLIAYFIRVSVILISLGLLIVHSKTQAILVSVNLLLGIIQSTMVSMVYYIEYSVALKSCKKNDIRNGVKISIFISNLIGLFFQLIFVSRMLSYVSNTIFHTIISIIYCGCIFYLLIHQFYLAPPLICINLLLSSFICLSLFLDYFVIDNPNKYTMVEQFIIILSYVFVSTILPSLVFSIVRKIQRNEAKKSTIS